jgi:nitrogen fixation/metabolism regulation signal transduction histidine kinase
MLKNLIKILWVYLFASFVAGYMFLLDPSVQLNPYVTFLFALGVLAWGYLTLRGLRFKRKLINFLKLLLSGDYKTGIKVNLFFNDEVKALGELINKAVDQLVKYDELRAEKVFLDFRALEAISRTVKEGVILADLDKEIFEFNPAAQSLFDIKQERITYNAVRKEEANRAFVKLFKEATEEEKIPKEDTVVMQLPMRNIRKELFVKIIPLKDRNEEVRLALVFVKEKKV